MESPSQILQELKQFIFTPPPALRVWEWAELRRRLGKDVTAKAGPYSVAFAPYQREPQESFTDSNVQMTVLYWGKRLGKTEIINNLHGSIIEQDPKNILHVMPKLGSAKKWSQQFFMPMVRSVEYLHSVIQEQRRRDSKNTILCKQYPGGVISGIGANSPSDFRQVQAPVVTCDEIDSMEDGAEGDPVSLAFGRSENFPDSINVAASTATEIFINKEDSATDGRQIGSKIHALWLASDQRKWFCKCPDCKMYHILEWNNIKQPKEKDWEHSFYECPQCRAHWDDAKRVQAIRNGEWRRTAPFSGIRGYWLNGLNTVFAAKKGFKSKLHQMAKEAYDADLGGEATLRVWTNQFLCEPIEENAEVIDPNPLLERRERYSPDNLPEEVICIGAAVDVQSDRLEYEIVGLGLDEETWGIEYGKITGNTERSSVWDDLKANLSRTFKRLDGVRLGISFAAIDHRHKGHQVRKFVKSCGLQHVYPVFGLGRSQQSLLVVPHKKKLYGCWLFSVNVDLGKDFLFARLKLKETGPRYMHFPIGFGYDEKSGYFKQLTAEKKVPRHVKGFLTHDYVKDPNVRNEAIDLRVYFLAGLDIRRPNIKRMAAELLQKRDQEQEPTVDKHGYVILKRRNAEQTTPTVRPRRRMNMAPGLQDLLK